MPIDAPLSVRATEQSKRDAVRDDAVQHMLDQAYLRRDTRVEEAKASEAARPTVAERAAEQPQPRPKSPNSGKLVDVLA
jgi:hypothetical protein